MKKSVLLVLITILILSALDLGAMTETLLFTNFARDNGGNIRRNAVVGTVTVQVYNQTTSQYIYTESFQEVSINDFGLFTVIVGTGSTNDFWGDVPFGSNIWVMINADGVPIQSISLPTLAWESDTKTVMYYTKADRELDNLRNVAINADLLPDANDSRSIGANDLRWNDLFLGPNSLNIGTIGDNATISYVGSEVNFDKGLQVNTGGIDVAVGGLQVDLGGVNIDGGGLIVDGTTYLNDGVELGLSGDLISFNGYVDTDVLPTGTINLGSSTYRWASGFFGPTSVHIGDDGDDVTLSYNTGTNTLGVNQNMAVTGSLTQGGYNVLTENTNFSGDITGTFNNLQLASGAVSPGDLDLTSSGWHFDASDARITNLSGGAAGSVPYQTAPNTTTFLGIGGANTIMTSTGSAPQWVASLNDAQLDNNLTISGGTVTNSTVTPGTGHVTADYFISGGSTNAVDLNSTEIAGDLPIANIAEGANGSVLMTNSGAPVWTSLNSVAWGLTGNSGTNSATNFIGTTDNQPLIIKSNNVKVADLSSGSNTLIGYNAMHVNNTGINNASYGFESMYGNTNGANNAAFGFKSLHENLVGNYNTALGSLALYANTASDNTAVGYSALSSNTSGNANVALGNQALQGNISGHDNTALGLVSMFTNTSGQFNTAVGNWSMHDNTAGSRNTAVGVSALLRNTTASYNTAVGNEALRDNTTGANNTAVGNQALLVNTASDNTAVGFSALLSNTTGSLNTAMGVNALQSNTQGDRNTAVGVNALRQNTEGYQNTAIGVSALIANTTGTANSASGYQALFSNTTGFNNNAFGYNAMYYNTTGSYNTANGLNALNSNTSGTYNTADGYNAGTFIANGTTPNQTSNTSTYLGASTKALTNGDANETVIGYSATGNGSNTVTLGNSSVTGLYSLGAYNGTSTALPNMVVDASGKIMRSTTSLGTMSTQNANNVSISGGTITGTPISGSTGSFTSFTMDAVTATEIVTSGEITGVLGASDSKLVTEGAVAEAIEQVDLDWWIETGVAGSYSRFAPVSGTNVNVIVEPLGTGAFQASSGGNARGDNAVDMQMMRSDVTHVASGDYSTIGGGWNNTASGYASFVGGGYSNMAGLYYCSVGGGFGNQATGHTSVVSGGDLNTASGYFSTVPGGMSNTAQSYGETVLGLFSTVGAGNASAYVATDRLFVIGNGTAVGSRSNALVMLKNGNTTISGTLAASNLSGSNTGDQTITLTGDVTGSGTGSFATTLANSGVSAGTYTSITVNAKGLATAGTNPTTLSGYGITDAWGRSGNAIATGEFIGTTNDEDVVIKRNNVQAGVLKNTSGNTSWGVLALNSISTGVANTGIGYNSLNATAGGRSNTSVGVASMLKNTSGSYNTAIGTDILVENLSGNDNTAAGYNALYYNTASNNTAYGTGALYSNTSGASNVAVGRHALYLNTSRGDLVAVGTNALSSNGQDVSVSWYGTENTAVGTSALTNNNQGAWNTSVGYQSMQNNTTGYQNTAGGTYSLGRNTLGNLNTGYGYMSLNRNEEGDNNTAVGAITFWNKITGDDNIAIGYQAGAWFAGAGTNYLTDVNNSIFIGAYTKPSANNNTNETVIGYSSEGHGSNTVTLGNSSVTGLYSMGAYNGTSAAVPNMVVDATGKIMRSTTSVVTTELDPQVGTLAENDVPRWNNTAGELQPSIITADATTATVAGTAIATEFRTSAGTASSMVIGEALSTAYVNIWDAGTAVLEFGRGAGAGTNYGIKINDRSSGSARAGIGNNGTMWVAGVQGTGYSAGALTTGGADAMVAVMSGTTPVFSADQNGNVYTDGTLVAGVQTLTGGAGTVTPTKTILNIGTLTASVDIQGGTAGQILYVVGSSATFTIEGVGTITTGATFVCTASGTWACVARN